MRTAQEAEHIMRNRLLCRRAAEAFDEMGGQSITMIHAIRSGDWASGARLGTNLHKALAEAGGAWSPQLMGHEKDKLQVAGDAIKAVLEAIPLQSQQLEGQALQDVLNRSYFLSEVASEIGGRLKYETWI